MHILKGMINKQQKRDKMKIEIIETKYVGIYIQKEGVHQWIITSTGLEEYYSRPILDIDIDKYVQIYPKGYQ